MQKLFQKTFEVSDQEVVSLFNNQIIPFLNNHIGKLAEFTVKVIKDDKPEYWQHKYLNGVLIPIIARESYSNDIFACSMELKKRFLIINCDSYDEIPPKHKENRTMYLFNQDEEIIGYIPSRANLNFEDMQKFIIQVEGLMMDLQASLNKDDMEIRRRACIN